VHCVGRVDRVHHSQRRPVAKRQVRTIPTRGVVAQGEVRHVDHPEWPKVRATKWPSLPRRAVVDLAPKAETCRSEHDQMVARGGVEPPTYRFSGDRQVTNDCAADLRGSVVSRLLIIVLGTYRARTRVLWMAAVVTRRLAPCAVGRLQRLFRKIRAAGTPATDGHILQAINRPSASCCRSTGYQRATLQVMVLASWVGSRWGTLLPPPGGGETGTQGDRPRASSDGSRRSTGPSLTLRRPGSRYPSD
jgi:hypothetical protein